MRCSSSRRAGTMVDAVSRQSRAGIGEADADKDFGAPCATAVLARINASALVAARLGPQPLVSLHGQIEREGIVLRAGDASGVVGQRGARQLVGGKALRHLEPPLHPRAGVGLRECPEMPGAPIPRIGALRPL